MDERIIPPADEADWEAWCKTTGDWQRPLLYQVVDFRDDANMDRPLILDCYISTWNDEDVIAADIRSAFRHGCDRVFVLDNDSRDDTVREATDAGATDILPFSTLFYQEELRIHYLNRWIKSNVERGFGLEKDVEHWAICLDADEFLQIPGGLTLRQYLTQLDASITTIGFASIDLYPTRKPEYVPGRHPADFQDHAWIRTTPPFCRTPHWKHPIIRYHDGIFDACMSRGCHIPFARPGVQLAEPTDTLYLYHCPFREEQATRRRLNALCGPQTRLDGYHRSVVDDARIDANGAIKRWRSLSAVYQQRWVDVELPHAQYVQQKIGVDVKPISELLTEAESTPLRWY